MENIILILGKDSVEVNKEKLANKSHYFASLFSHNFSDSHEKEHVINYNIDLSTLQIFIKWIEDDAERVDPDCYSIKSSMTQFASNDFKELLNLLQLSVLYTVQEFTDDIIQIIVLFWLVPEKIIDIWLLAEELNVKVLQDICLSECLDRFEELPLHSLVQLTKDKISQLLLNVNVRSSTEHLQFVRQEWMQRNTITDMPKIEIERQPKFMQGIVFYKIEQINRHDVLLYTWNDYVFSKCTQVKHVHCTRKGIVGMQVVGRGFSMYAVGGECGLGTGHFNKTIWRYCLISKNWYYKAKLRVPRRHMVAAFLGNKLVVAGGVGTHRLKLHTVDILDIHTGEWKEGAEVPESFTDIPPHCVVDDKLLLVKSSLYIYDLKGNHWQSVRVYSTPGYCTVDVLLSQNTTIFLLGTHLGDTIISKLNLVKDSVCKKEECLKQYLEHRVINSAANIDFLVEKDWYDIRYMPVHETGVLLLNNCGKQYLHVHTEIKRDFESFTIPRTGCFNIIDPNTLYNTV